ncbi:hypothetical protein LXL04_024833 [Taraxacum kok-saghyz]
MLVLKGGGGSCKRWRMVVIVVVQWWQRVVVVDDLLKSVRRSIDSKVLPTRLIKTRWNKWLPSKVNIYIWRLRLGRIPTRRKLSERGIDVGSTLCPVCGTEQETIEHLFFQCNVADEVWRLVYNWLQVQRGVVHDISTLFDWVDGLARKKKLVDVVVNIQYLLITLMLGLENSSIQHKKRITVGGGTLTLNYYKKPTFTY